MEIWFYSLDNISPLMNEERKKMLKSLARFGTVGLEMGFAVAMGALIGYYLDRFFGTKPWLSLIFLFFGIAAAFKRLIDVAKKVKFNDLENR